MRAMADGDPVVQSACREESAAAAGLIDLLRFGRGRRSKAAYVEDDPYGLAAFQCVRLADHLPRRRLRSTMSSHSSPSRSFAETVELAAPGRFLQKAVCAFRRHLAAADQVDGVSLGSSRFG